MKKIRRMYLYGKNKNHTTGGTVQRPGVHQRDCKLFQWHRQHRNALLGVKKLSERENNSSLLRYRLWIPWKQITFLQDSSLFKDQAPDPRGFLGLLLNERLRFPDMKCTSYLKTMVTDKWIRHHREQLGPKCLFLSGERRDESIGREKLPELEYHSTTLKTRRVAGFTCHWYRPCLDYEKGKMFERGRELHLEPHPCYEYIGRCSCMFCVLMPDRHAAENIKRYPEIAAAYVRVEMQLNHRWKQASSLQSIYNECLDIGDIDEDLLEDFRQMSLFETIGE